MKRTLLFLAVAAVLAGCSGEKRDPQQALLTKEPLSVRGWIADVKGAPNAPFRTVETETVRKMHLFQSTSVWVDNAPYVSGGVAENGSFILLDVPPGNVTITFTAPGAQDAKLALQGVPGNADVLVPAILLEPGGVTLLEPQNVKVRLAARIDKPRPTGRNATIAGHPIPIIEVPIAEMVDRRDYPPPPTSAAPLATVK